MIGSQNTLDHADSLSDHFHNVRTCLDKRQNIKELDCEIKTSISQAVDQSLREIGRWDNHKHIDMLSHRNNLRDTFLEHITNSISVPINNRLPRGTFNAIWVSFRRLKTKLEQELHQDTDSSHSSASDEEESDEDDSGGSKDAGNDSSEGEEDSDGGTDTNEESGEENSGDEDEDSEPGATEMPHDNSIEEGLLVEKPHESVDSEAKSKSPVELTYNIREDAVRAYSSQSISRNASPLKNTESRQKSNHPEMPPMKIDHQKERDQVGPPAEALDEQPAADLPLESAIGRAASEPIASNMPEVQRPDEQAGMAAAGLIGRSAQALELGEDKRCQITSLQQHASIKSEGPLPTVNTTLPQHSSHSNSEVYPAITASVPPTASVKDEVEATAARHQGRALVLPFDFDKDVLLRHIDDLRAVVDERMIIRPPEPRIQRKRRASDPATPGSLSAEAMAFKRRRTMPARKERSDEADFAYRVRKPRAEERP